MQLATLYELEQISVHFPHEIDWDHLPERCVIQIHWYPNPEFVARLAAQNVRVVVLARHPMDVLMSWLNLVYYKHEDGRCPGNGSCTECGIVGVAPGSDVFVDYAGSYYGRVMLCYSPAWWDKPGVARARYEDFLSAPAVELGRLVEQLGAAPGADRRGGRSPFAERDADQARGLAIPLLARSGRSLASFDPARRGALIYDGVHEPFDVLGYLCDPDETLDPLQAEFNWARVQLDSTRDHLIRVRDQQMNLAREVKAARDTGSDAQGVGDERRDHEETRRAFAMLARVSAPPAQTSGWLARWWRPSHAVSPSVPRPHYSSQSGVMSPSDRSTIDVE